VSPAQHPTEQNGGAVALRPWWIAPDGLQPPGHESYEPNGEEQIIAARVFRQTALGHFRIPQIPAIAARVVALLAKPDADGNEISRLIHEDQQLAADVIAFSNSSLFAGATKNTNIPQAIGRVGFRRTRSLIFAASLRAVIYSGCEATRAENLWRHAVGCAAISACIAQNLRCNADDLYLAGLLHDVGKTVVLSLLDTIALRCNHLPLRPEFVDHMLVLHHENVGCAVVTHWALPPHVEEAVRSHTDTAGIEMTRQQAIVALANNACHRLGVGETDDGRLIAGPSILEALGAAEVDLPRILEGVPLAARRA
jgi:putative nucleotidyltransferase with HDIG domain